jgi:hypothetical protein
MKRIALTFTLLATWPVLSFAGPEQLSAKDMQPTLAPVAPVEWYADNEWNIGVWGTYVFTQNGGESAPEEGITLWTSDRYLGADEAWGGGIDLKYFFHRYFGVGIEGFGLAVHRDAPETTIDVGEDCVAFTPQDEDKGVGAVLGTFTLRYPIGSSRFAPYIFAGIGAIFGGGDVEHLEFGGHSMGEAYFEVYRGGDDTEMLGELGGGLEVRFTRHIGITADCSWNVLNGPSNNFGMVRSGLNFAF